VMLRSITATTRIGPAAALTRTASHPSPSWTGRRRTRADAPRIFARLGPLAVGCAGGSRSWFLRHGDPLRSPEGREVAGPRGIPPHLRALTLGLRSLGAEAPAPAGEWDDAARAAHAKPASTVSGREAAGRRRGAAPAGSARETLGTRARAGSRQ
jgi:hypothetical protein